MSKTLPLLLFFCILFFCHCKVGKNEPLFQLMDASETGIEFSNDLSNSDSLIALSFEYLFNGSGVAIGDFNNDGLSDVFFTGNMKPSRLYLNKGEMKFEDITTSSQINTQGKWASGAAVVDINQDGWLDIYVCVGGLSSNKEKRANLLFINQKNNTFTEEAKAYGLDDSGYSINAAFFDYDQDGDLDLYLLTTELDPYNWTEFRPRRINGEAPNQDKLYRNNRIHNSLSEKEEPKNNSKTQPNRSPLGDRGFTEVSKEAGIQIEGYGLGLGLCDLNEDGWTDIYVANDFLSNDIIYINNQDGTFTDKIDDYLSHTSRNGMGTDLQDFNNDGHTDIIVLDMLPTSNVRQKSMFGFFNYDKFQLGIKNGYQPQYARNTLQLNNGNGTFSEVGQLAGVDQTDWSWCSLFADFDNDGWQDLFITNGYRQDITNLDFATYSRQVGSSPVGTEEAKVKQMMEKLQELPEIKLPNYMFKNTGDFPFEDKSKEWGFDLPSYSNGAAYADLDNDGDLDLVVNNIDENAFVYKNNLYQKEKRDSSNYLRIKLLDSEKDIRAIGAKVKITYDDKEQHRMISPYRGYLSSVENVLHFGLGKNQKVDLIEITWSNGRQQFLKDVDANQLLEIELRDVDATPIIDPNDSQSVFFENANELLGIDFTHQEKDFVDFKIQPVLPHKHSQGAPSIAVGDINGDGLEDFFVGGSAGFTGKIFLQNQNGFEERDLKQHFHNNTFTDKDFHDMGSLFFDVEGDGDLDLYVVSGGTNFQNKKQMYQDRLYINDGLGNFQKSNGLPKNFSSGCDVSAADFDKDGDLDLFITGRVTPGAYPTFPKSYLLRNDSKNGKIQFADISNHLPYNGKIGMVSSMLWTDYDNDGFVDILLCGEWMPLTFLKNENGNFVNHTKFTINNSNGWWNSLVAGDFDQDGDTDYVAGNLGLNTRYEASQNQPVQMYAKDYDKNGRVDPILAHHIEGEKYIAHSRDMLIKQINSMRVRFKTYMQYGSTPFEKSFTKKELEDAQILESENFASSYIENLGNGKFKMSPLPMAAQVAPLYGMIAEDVNNDGHLDLIAVGNSYATEIMVGQYDACKGIVMIGDGKGNFKNVNIAESGFFVDKDAKALSKIMIGENQSAFLASRNRGKLAAFFPNKKKSKYLKIDQNISLASVVGQNGKEYKVEFYFGSSYLSQSTRTLEIPKDTKSITLFDTQGKSKTVNF